MTPDKAPSPTDAEAWALWTSLPLTGSAIQSQGDFARAVLAKWGSPAVAGEQVAIREAISHFRLTHWADEDGGLGLADALAQLYGDDDIGRASEELDMLADAIASIATPPAQAADSVLEDAARLDWLALAGPTSICVVFDRPHDSEVEVATDDVTGYGKTLREAIDDARKQGANHD